MNHQNQYTPPDDTTMIIYQSRNPIDPQRKRDLALRCGVKCIKLRYAGTLSAPDGDTQGMTVGISGFQHVKLATQPKKGGGTESVAFWHKNEFTNEPIAEGSMTFVCDEMGSAFAYLPDGAFNRVRLACAEMSHNANWFIEDEKVLAEIRDLANVILTSVEHRIAVENEERMKAETDVVVREKGIISGIHHKSRAEIELEVIKKQIKDLEIEQETAVKRKELKERVEALQAAKAGLVDKPEDSVEKFPENVQTKTGAKPVEVDAENALTKQATAEIYAENSELIDKLKEDRKTATGKTQGWAFTAEYRKTVKPLIENRVKEIKEKREHSTAGVAT